MTGSRAPFLLVTAAYHGFSLSDGALRVLVLLHLYGTGRPPLELLAALLPYEIAGVVANLLAGLLGARKGLRALLLLGLSLQFLAIALLWASPALVLVMLAQLVSGIAKDLVKTGAKSSVAALADAPAGLFRTVAVLTGGKNAQKGLGHFLGGLLLLWPGYSGGLVVLAVLVLVALLLVVSVPGGLGRASAKPPLRALLAQEPWLNWLALARLFLFGSRDTLLAVALPLFLVAELGWSTAAVGGLLALWVIGYGGLQALAPRLLRPRDERMGARQVAWVTLSLAAPLGLAFVLLGAGAPPGAVLGLALLGFGVLFALDSSLHSWLVVCRGGEAVALRVGFYYAGNALGRVLGMVASAVLFTAGGEGLAGMRWCLLGAIAAVLAAACCSRRLLRLC